MAPPLIRTHMLELLADGDMTAATISEELGALRNSVDKALARAREEREVHIVAYVRQAAVYRLGEGVDFRPEAPAPASPAEQRPDANDVRAKAPDAAMPIYFELDGGLLPGVRHFSCGRLKATAMSVEACSARWQKANSTDVDADRMNSCKHCSVGAQHSGRANHNPSKLRGMTICGRCRTGATRLIGKHLCVSCYNREREYLIGKNAKGTAPIKLAKLVPRKIRFMSGNVPKTLYRPLSVDTEELIISALRDSKDAPRFWYSNTAMDWLLDERFDRSIGDDEEVPGAHVVEDAHQAAVQVAGDTADVAHAGEPVTTLPGVLADPHQALRDLIERDDRPVPLPSISKHAAKRHKKAQQRVVRLSSITSEMLRSIGALRAPPVPVPVPVPVPAAQLYNANLMSGGQASG